ncbi:BcepGomrgp27 [Burkholderia phage BcepGomr]|uniref:BcepGomrgp27 n=1 Tax=Burkholderia phage BcepGomr TaxID=437329 RepID=UPI00015034C8|nr:BcepGomrgp27 [Burkholderia phage BcepGomr]ABP63598.1 BcepGomrgp27 [Burkholderia phage BcepGomr]
MTKILNWFAATRFRMSLSHIPEGLLIQTVTIGLILSIIWVVNGRLYPGNVTGAAWVGSINVCVWYWSRKKLETEIDAQQPGQSHAYLWSVGWFPFQWTWARVLDWSIPTTTSLMLPLVCKSLGL